jgi:hypothetical protein
MCHNPHPVLTGEEAYQLIPRHHPSHRAVADG